MSRSALSEWWEENRAAARDVTRFIRKRGWKNSIRRSFRLKYLPWWLVLVATVVVTVVFTVFRNTIVDAIQPKREAIINFPCSWIFPLLATILISATPFSGRQITLILIGLIYDLKIALLISAVGVLVGEIFCYFVFKGLFARKAAEIEERNLFYAAIAQSQRRSGIIFLSVVRYSIIPSRIVSATQAIVGVPIFKYMLAVVISMPKQLAETWLGALIAGNTRNKESPEKSGYTTATIVLLLVTFVTGPIAFYEVYMRARRYYPQLKAQRAAENSARGEMSSEGSDGSDTEQRCRENLVTEKKDQKELGIEKSCQGSLFYPIAR